MSLDKTYSSYVYDITRKGRLQDEDLLALTLDEC